MPINNSIIINKKDIKILKYISKKKSVTRKILIQKFSDPPARNRIALLTNNKYIRCNKHSHGTPLPDNATYTLTDAGICEVENRKWFNWQFIVKELLCPTIVSAIVSVITTLITLFLAG